MELFLKRAGNAFKTWRTAAVLCLAVMLAVCIAWAAPQETGTAGKAQDEAPKVLARVDGQDITEADVYQLLQSMGPQAMMIYGSEQGRRMVLDQLISMKLFAVDGAKAKLDETPEFKAAMEGLRSRLLAQAAMQEIIKDVTVTDDEARKYYDGNPEQFTRPERIHARHILISDDASSADMIAKVQADLKSGVSFDEIARAVSICPSAPQGGDLGEFEKGQMVPEFEKAAFALKNPGDVSEPVRTQFGWHIIKLEGRTPAETVAFEEVKSQILPELENEKISELLKARTDELKKIYSVEIIEPEPVSGDVKK